MSRVSAALRRPTESGQLLRQVLFFVPTPLPVLVLAGLMVGGRLSAPGWTILLAGSVAVASLLLALMVQPTPLPEGLSAEASVRRSLHRFRQIASLRIALALTPVAVGAGAALAGGGLLPLLVTLALAWPQLLLAAPTFFTITRARRAMEAWGTRAYLWAALAQPAPVEWPVATALAARYRTWQQKRATRQTAAASGAAAAGEDSAAGAAAGGAGASERTGATGEEPQDEPGGIVPGLAGGSGSAATGPRPVPRQPRSNRRKGPASRSGGNRPKAKN
ncbi:hypothetical protein HNR25_004588 [Streptomonospora salina]|uniref:Uncharacterized protein n=1 Tax=Streptomonospora salina TaxID=104205 RepID=A0A841E9Z3_9ACTN|nr:hypothetical protein [Streptomonospora salina]MBB6000837.1 hypothetical protein [Streptomonospora salina]